MNASACRVDVFPALDRPTTPVCSICVANYNGVEMLKDCLESIYGQADDIDVEVIVHDDASNDGSVNLLRRAYPRVEVLASSENVGFCISNNRMVEHARGEFVLLLNNDAALEPAALRTLVSCARERSERCIVTLPQFDWETGVAVDRGCLLDPFFNPIPNLDPDRAHVAMAIGACLFLPRSLWMELGGFPEWIGSIGEDLYLCCAARLRGVVVIAAPGSGYRHRQGASFGGNRVTANQMQSTFRRRRLSETNKTAVLFICTPTILAYPLLFGHVLLLCVEGIAMSMLRLDKRLWQRIYWPSLATTFRRRRTLTRARGGLQRQRTISVFTFFSAFSPFPRKLVMLARHGVPRIQ